MNKADNVPIATLSGIASLTEIAAELPLPSSNNSSKNVQLFSTPQDAALANSELQRVQSLEELQRISMLLGEANTAYLDFKNSSYNVSMPLNDPNKLPVGLQQVLQMDPNLFQPKYDSYHGSPLKSNSLSSLAYSPNQRNAFIRQQTLQQMDQQQVLTQQYKGHHVQNLFMGNPKSDSPVASSSRLPDSSKYLPQPYTAQPHPQQQQHHTQQQQQQYTAQANLLQQQQQQQQQQQYTTQANLLQQQQQQQQYTVQAQLLQQQHPQQQQQRPQQQQQTKVLAPVQKQIAHVQEQLAHVQEQLASVQGQQAICVQDQPISDSIKCSQDTQIHAQQSLLESQFHTQPKYQPSVKIKQVAVPKAKTEIPGKPQDDDDAPFFSPLKTRGQRQDQIPPPHIKEETPLSPASTAKLELRVPKLVVRKVKRIEGNNEVETLEVCSPDKDRAEFYDNSTAKEYDPAITDTFLKKRTRSRSSRKSSRSSVGSVDSFNNQAQKKQQKRKKKTLSTSSSDDTDGGLEQEIKRFRPQSDVDDVIEGVEVKVEVKKFLFTLNKILDREMELEADGELDINDDVEIPPETLLPKPLVSMFSSEIVQMKSSKSLNEIPVDQLVRVMSVMDRHVRDTMMLSVSQDSGDEEESKRWLSIQSERIVRSAEAAAVILNITTAPDMPKQVYLEEAIEHVATFCQHQLENIIYPEFDGIYKLPDTKDSFAYKTKRNYRSSASNVKRKPTLQIYNKICEVVSLLGDLVEMENLTDSIILKISQIGISPFFVENVNVLQLEALKVSRTVFRNYVKHRDLILDDILASLTRLPSNKRNLRNYRLQDNVCIQMFTALVLQLVQCTVQIPENLDDEGDDKSGVLVDKDVLIVKSYEDALRAAQNFMGMFLKKCSATKDENDFRPLFENFLHDLFLSTNLPEWPAAEVLLTQLGRLFVVTFSNPKNDMTLRSTALDYLAQIATHLRKSVLKSQSEAEVDKLKVIVDRLINVDSDDETPIVDDMDVYDEKLRRSLLQYLLSCVEKDSSFKYAREFYLGQWIRDVQIEIEKSMIAPMLSIPGAATATVDDDDDKVKTEVSAEKLQILQEKKQFYHTLIRDKVVSTLRSAHQLSYEKSCAVVHHFASMRVFSQSFDLYMQQIFKMLSEQAIGLRTKAVKALTQIVSVDETILAREDVQASVHGRLLDPSTNVREAAVDLIGQFVLKCPELIKQYYDMIIARILDTGVSVRKRVIKILKDICIEHPDYDKIPEICSKMIRRVDDEVGIKKLVTEVFRAMWFQPLSDVSKQSNELYTRAVNVTKVVSLCKDTGFDWLESLLDSLFDPENPTSRSVTIKACQQLVDCLVMRMLKPEAKLDSNVVNSCLITLYLFCKSYPKLLVPHASTLQPYLSSKINNQNDTLVTQNVSKILELIVPLMEHPNPKFLAELEEDTMKLILKQSQNVVQSSASCLAAIINNCTHNYKFVVDAFNQLYRFLVNYKSDHMKNPTHQLVLKRRPTLLRALFTIGLFCRYFDLNKHFPECSTSSKQPAASSDGSEITTKVFELVLYFSDFKDVDIATKALLSIGFIGIRHPHLLLTDKCRKLYEEVLSPNYSSGRVKYSILMNLQNHLVEEEQRLQNAEGHKNKSPVKKRKPTKVEFDKADIKEMGDALSGTTSEIVQVFLKDIMQCFLHAEKKIRILSLQVVAIILRQGLVHPAQCIPYLIAISTDSEKLCHIKAEQCLNDLDSRYQGFIHMKAFQGVKMSYQLQKIVQKNDSKDYLCGYREGDNKMALLNHVYGMVRSNKQYRRPYVLSVLKLMDDKKSSPDLLYYLAENIAYATYNTQEEPLFIIHHIDTIASVSGTNILQNFREVLHANEAGQDDVDDDEKEEQLSQDTKLDMTKLAEVTRESFGCLLLLELKSYLKLLYGFTDNKCQKYSPSQPSKLYDKSITRKTNQDFESEHKNMIFSKTLTRDEMLEYYFQFKQLMLSLDADRDSDSEEQEQQLIKRETPSPPPQDHLPTEENQPDPNDEEQQQGTSTEKSLENTEESPEKELPVVPIIT